MSSPDDDSSYRPLMPLWEEVAASAPPPDTRPPLTDDEAEELRRSVDEDGPRGLDLRERQALDRVRLVRTPERIAREEAVVRAELAGEPYGHGCLDAIAWALGRCDRAPLTNEVRPGLPSRFLMWEVALEGQKIVEAATGQEHTRPREEYALGVGTALLWLTGRSAETPWSR